MSPSRLFAIEMNQFDTETLGPNSLPALHFVGDQNDAVLVAQRTQTRVDRP